LGGHFHLKYIDKKQDAKNNIPGFKLSITDLSGANLKTY
jgi:hypothetical protein